MIKVIGITKRKPGLTLAEFAQYWHEKHAPLGFKILPREISLNRYVHNYALPFAEGVEFPFDGATEFCFDDIQAYQQWFAWFLSDDAKALRDDGENFMDYSTSQVVLTEERVIIPPTPALKEEDASINPMTDLVKIIAMVKRKPGLTLAEFAQYWYEVHVPLAMRVLTEEVAVKGYVHNYAIPLDNGEEPAFDGIGVLYFKDMDALMKSNEWFFGEIGQFLRDDEENFVDTSTRIAAVVQERVIRPWSVVADS